MSKKDADSTTDILCPEARGFGYGLLDVDGRSASICISAVIIEETATRETFEV